MTGLSEDDQVAMGRLRLLEGDLSAMKLPTRILEDKRKSTAGFELKFNRGALGFRTFDNFIVRHGSRKLVQRDFDSVQIASGDSGRLRLKLPSTLYAHKMSLKVYCMPSISRTFALPIRQTIPRSTFPHSWPSHGLLLNGFMVQSILDKLSRRRLMRSLWTQKGVVFPWTN